MENKYYTPELHEFFDKFEYESFDIIWKKEIFDFRDLDVIDDEIREGKIRVKHLDREDIESLGWEYKKDDLGYWDFCRGNNRLQFFPEKEKNVSIFMNSYKIKNKSELRKLMQMLNIG